MKTRIIKLVSVLLIALTAGSLLALTPSDRNNSSNPPSAKKQLWWDPMLGPSSITDHPGKSAMGMEMVPYTTPAAGGGEIEIDPRVVQDMGVQTAPVVRGPLQKTVRAAGMFQLPESGLHDVALKVGGWIDKLDADQEGMHVHKGQPLFELYSPQLQVAGQELIAAVHSQRALGSDANPTLKTEAQRLVKSARRKLQLLDVDEQEIEKIAKANEPPRDVVFYSPATGHLEDKAVVQGSAVQPGQRLMRVADHSVMWLNVEVYEEQIPLVKMGQTVEATLDAIPGKTFRGTVSFIYPHLDHMTRTLAVRAAFDNPDFQLRPGMFADAKLVAAPISDALQVPQEAVIDTGTRQLVFVAQGDGHFIPRTVEAGIRGDHDTIQILKGLDAGETVVTSGQFLMDVESRTQEAIAKLSGGASSSSQLPAAQMTASPTSMPTSNPSLPAKLSLVYCPMEKANWLQEPGPVANPFLGPDMLDCGDVKSELPTPAGKSPLAPVISDYLAAQRALSAGHFDAKLLKQLQTDSAKLKGDSYQALRKASQDLADSPNLKAAHSRFKAVSEALIPLVNQSAKK